jgi:AraC-like DNA-binding protein
MTSFGDPGPRSSERRPARLEPAASLESYIANPIGFFVASDNAAIFSAGTPPEAIEGLSFWGRPGDGDVDMIASTLRGDKHLLARPCAFLVDLRRLDCIDLGVFGKLPCALAPRCERSRRLADRHAVLRPEGAAGSIAVELFLAMSHGCPARSFVDAREALDWIGIEQPALLDDLERIRGSHPGHPPLIGELRELLARSPSLTVREAARQLGVSQRTLQRRLREMGTSFQREVDLGRLKTAKGLMRLTHDPLKCIALEAGYLSPQHFSSAFHRHTGMSPGRWRGTRLD